MLFLLYVAFPTVLFIICPWLTYKWWGVANHLGLFIVLCRRHKLTRWLAWNVWGNDDSFYDNIEKDIREWKKSLGS